MDKKKVLIIDDEKLIVRSTALALQYFGYDTIEAFSGMQGIQAAGTETPHVILLDIMMPGMDGWEVLAWLKENPGTAAIPVIIFTAKEYSNGCILAKQRGAIDYIAKPFEPEQLDRMLRKHTGQ
jgi:DNA-binding response OmpR family regulator